jgi:hypothetical protein
LHFLVNNADVIDITQLLPKLGRNERLEAIEDEFDPFRRFHNVKSFEIFLVPVEKDNKVSKKR